MVLDQTRAVIPGDRRETRDPGTPADVAVLDPGSKLRFARDDARLCEGRRENSIGFVTP
jgi:hypothetical protein